jgi:hypothetical protein
MANNEIKDIYDVIKQYVNDDTDLTEDYMDKINRHFYTYLKNPTDKQEETFKRLRDALITMWLADLFKRAVKQALRQVAVGVNFGKQALKQADIKKIISKTITSDKIKQMVQAHVDKALTEMAYVSNGIKVNSDRAISDIKSNFDKTKKAISTELMAEFSDYGITYYEDRAGRRQDMSSYVNRKVTHLLINSFRDSFIAEMVRNGVEYAIVRRLPTTAIECEACIPYDDAILSFYDNDLGYETVADARMNGLFHYYCFHYLEPVDMPQEKSNGIEHSELNNKTKARNEKNNVVMGLFS